MSERGELVQFPHIARRHPIAERMHQFRLAVERVAAERAGRGTVVPFPMASVQVAIEDAA